MIALFANLLKFSADAATLRIADAESAVKSRANAELEFRQRSDRKPAFPSACEGCSVSV